MRRRRWTSRARGATSTPPTAPSLRSCWTTCRRGPASWHASVTAPTAEALRWGCSRAWQRGARQHPGCLGTGDLPYESGSMQVCCRRLLVRSARRAEQRVVHYAISMKLRLLSRRAAGPQGCPGA